MQNYPDFQRAVQRSIEKLLTLGKEIHPNNWQSMDVSQRKEALMLEILNTSFTVPMGSESLSHYRSELQPNLPWADLHFELERVSGLPINPGETWKAWPWGLSADKFRTEGELFSHSYAERYWCNYTPSDNDMRNTGIRYPYGDLNDVVSRLIADPLTRQAVLSVWHPEDQFNGGQRVPCSLFYHFIQRFGYLHIIYTIRSCDALRHLKDDIYLTARLLLWVLEQLRRHSSPEFDWGKVKPGLFTMHITSLHCFKGDYAALQKMITTT